MGVDQAERNELARTEVLAYLAGYPSVALEARTIHRRLSKENDFSLSEVVDALNFHLDGKLVKSERGQFGKSLYWQITREGTLAYERSF